jgi:glycosyltransferase involved in cell wall biosynthesis
VGTPVIVATGSCLEEAGGPDTPAVNPDNCDEWIAVMTQMIEHPEVRAEIAAKGKEYVSRFNDDAMANDTMSCYLKALNAK